jgi:hypothetical protein
MNLMRWLVLGLLLMSCDTGMYGDGVLTEGTYVGVFLRNDPLADTIPANVTITITGDRFEGSSSIRNIPAICEGRVRSDGRSVEFENECVFTADFDWTYILNGTFQASTERKTLILTKSYGPGRYDTYHLTRE